MRALAMPMLLVLAVFAATVAGLVAYLVTSDESAGAEDDVTLSDIVGDPARYEGDRVTITGEWADNEHFSPDQAEEVIVLGDDADHALLVVPNLGVRVPELDGSSVVAVEGVVRVPKRTGSGYVAPDALMERDDGGVRPIVAADSVELLSGPEEPLAVEAEQVTVRQLLRDPRAWDERALTLAGTVTRATVRGFTLAQDGARIFVSAPASDLAELDAGERVRIRAELSRLSAYGADALERALQSDPPGDRPPSSIDAGDVPIEVGDPYLLLRGLDPRA